MMKSPSLTHTKDKIGAWESARSATCTSAPAYCGGFVAAYVVGGLWLLLLRMLPRRTNAVGDEAPSGL